MLVDIPLSKLSSYKRQYEIDDINICSNISYSNFFEEYVVKNIPCIIKNVTAKWSCSKDWIENGKPNIGYLASKYKDSEVMISNCSVSATNSNCKEKMTLQEYFLTYYHSADNLWYLKDWHLRRENPGDSFYTVPEYFASDWLNEYAVDNELDDFMFVYIGPQESWTMFHADVYSSFSWSANIVGRKRWLLFPPGEEKQFVDSFGNFPQDIKPYLNNNVKYFNIVQNQGDAIFVPSGWYHQVLNEEDTISINHNWVNGSNIDIMWEALLQNLLSVEEEIKEFKGSSEWDDHCQVMLKALFGINYKDFFKFIHHLATKRLSGYIHGTKINFQDWYFGKNHILFDLDAIKNVLDKMIHDVHFDSDELQQMNNILKDINEIESHFSN